VASLIKNLQNLNKNKEKAPEFYEKRAKGKICSSNHEMKSGFGKSE